MISYSRLRSTLVLDFKNQYRNGFYLVMLLVLSVSVILLSFVPKKLVELIFPIFILTNLVTSSFLFIGVLVLFERDQDLPNALNVTPISPHEYLISKILSLSLLSMIEVTTLVAYSSIIIGVELQELNLLAGGFVLILLYCLIGFCVVAKYQNFESFMSKGITIGAILSLPVVNFFTTSPITEIVLFIIPTNSALLVMSIPGMTIIHLTINVILNGIWIVLIYKLAIHLYETNYENRRR